MSSREVLPLIEWAAGDPQDEVATLKVLTEGLSIDPYLVEGKLVIGHDDTLEPGYAGGPCAGFSSMVEFNSLSGFLIEETNFDASLSEGKQLQRDLLTKWADFLEFEAAAIRRHIATIE